MLFEIHVELGAAVSNSSSLKQFQTILNTLVQQASFVGYELISHPSIKEKTSPPTCLWPIHLKLLQLD